MLAGDWYYPEDPENSVRSQRAVRLADARVVRELA
jgi:hypothetical protein